MIEKRLVSKLLVKMARCRSRDQGNGATTAARAGNRKKSLFGLFVQVLGTMVVTVGIVPFKSQREKTLYRFSILTK